VAAIPQIIQSAKELYDLRSRYKDASVLITAIYSESLVIAAALSQVQILLQHDALQNKPQLLETFDRALTGCRVVYGCLEEEVRDLVAKTDSDDLRFKDRAKFLWNEATFKDLLTQIRGQQSALSLLIQGLQMESIADVKQLVQENSVTLDLIVKRSRTLRQSHPHVTIPDSVFNDQIKSKVERAVDADSIAKSAEFSFDDEIVNSRSYRRAMAKFVRTQLSIQQSRPKQTTGVKSEEAWPSPAESKHTSETTSVFSKLSSASSYTVYDTSQTDPQLPRIHSRQPLPLAHKASYDISGSIRLTQPAAGPSVPQSFRNADMHKIWKTLLDGEHKYIDRMIGFRKMFYQNVVRRWPILEQHMQAILIGEQLVQLNRTYLSQVMQDHISDADTTLCPPEIFENWTARAQKLFKEYCRKMPHAMSSLNTTQENDLKFSPFVNTLGLSIAYFGKSWEDYLRLPNIQLQSYVENLQSLVNIAEMTGHTAATHEATRLRRALEAVTWLRTTSSAQLEAAQSREENHNLERCLQKNAPGILELLRLLEPARRIIRQGRMAMKWKSQGSWYSVHVVLLDNYLLWGKSKPLKIGKEHKLAIVDAPIAVGDLELNYAHQPQKSTILDEITRGTTLYIIAMKNMHTGDGPNMLGLYSSEDREAWWSSFMAVTKLAELARIGPSPIL
ncbi:hypothetical protein T440DRAFT_388390, partial [Plenodomus tracheiphilus IPT5]